MNSIYPFYVRYIDYEKVLDSTEHKAIFKSLRTIGINETFVTVQEDIYIGTTARLNVNYEVSDETQILRGVKQKDSIPPKLFTASIQEVFRNAQLEGKGINVDEEKWRT